MLEAVDIEESKESDLGGGEIARNPFSPPLPPIGGEEHEF
jgi:hypothetical protein